MPPALREPAHGLLGVTGTYSGLHQQNPVNAWRPETLKRPSFPTFTLPLQHPL